MNHILTISTDDERKTEVVRLHIGHIDPRRAAITVLDALSKIEPTRRQRSDAGKKREAKPE